MNEYKFGKGQVVILTNKNSVSVSKLITKGKIGELVNLDQIEDTVTLKFTSLRSIENMIQKLQEVRNTMAKKVLEAL